MMTSTMSAVIAALVIATSPAIQASPAGVDAAPPTAAEQPDVPRAQTEAPAASRAASGLPQRAPDPRTLGEFWPVFAGFVVTWIAIMAYMLSFNRRITRVGESLAELTPTEDV